MFEPEAPASRVQRQLCTVPATLLWWVRSSCKTHGQMIVCTPSCLWPRVEFLCLLCTKTQLFCFHLPKNPVRHGIIHCRNGMCKEEKYTTGHNKEGSGVSTSRPPELPPNCPLCSVSAIFACGVLTQHPQRQLTAPGAQPRFLITCVFFLFFRCASAASPSHPLLVQDVSAAASAAPC